MSEADKKLAAANVDVKRIRGRVRSNKYRSLVDGISTFDTASMFEDMRTLLKACETVESAQREAAIDRAMKFCERYDTLGVRFTKLLAAAIRQG